MKIKEGFELKTVAGEKMIFYNGKKGDAFKGTLVLNDVSTFVYNKLQKDISYEELINEVTGSYLVSDDIAKADIEELLRIFRKHKMIEG